MPLAFDNQSVLIHAGFGGARNCLLHQQIDIVLQMRQLVGQLCADVLKGFACKMAIEVIGCVCELAGRVRLLQLQQAVLYITLRRDHHHQNPCR